jgi:hypothetical protein
MLAAAITSFHAEPWAGPFFWFSYQDNGSTGSSNETYFGLIRADGSHKPAYDTYRQLIAQYHS